MRPTCFMMLAPLAELRRQEEDARFEIPLSHHAPAATHPAWRFVAACRDGGGRVHPLNAVARCPPHFSRAFIISDQSLARPGITRACLRPTDG